MEVLKFHVKVVVIGLLLGCGAVSTCKSHHRLTDDEMRHMDHVEIESLREQLNGRM